MTIRPTLRGLACALALCVTAGMAHATEFTLLIRESPADFALRGDKTEKGAAYWESYAKLGEAMKAAGVMRGGAPLQDDAAARSVTLQDGKPVATAPDASALKLGGYFIIDVKSMDEAVAWAARIPAARNGAVEVHENLPMVMKP